MMQMNDEVEFALIAIEEERRVLVCAPDIESQLRELVARLGKTSQFEVVTSNGCPEGQVLIIDLNAVAAAWAQSLATMPAPVLPPEPDYLASWGQEIAQRVLDDVLKPNPRALVIITGI